MLVKVKGTVHKKTNFFSLLSALFLLVPAVVCAQQSDITAQQSRSGENFIKALMKNDLKRAFQLFSPAVSGKYPFQIFAEIQNNVRETIGVPVSYTLKSVKTTTAKDAPPARLYDMVYARGAKKTSIPLELTFDPADPLGRLTSFKFLKAEMKQAGN